jgi:hypothetical protein
MELRHTNHILTLKYTTHPPSFYRSFLLYLDTFRLSYTLSYPRFPGVIYLRLGMICFYFSLSYER